MHNPHRNFDVGDVFIMMSDIGSHCDYFAYLKFSFEINLLREMKSCGDIVSYEPCDRMHKL